MEQSFHPPHGGSRACRTPGSAAAERAALRVQRQQSVPHSTPFPFKIMPAISSLLLVLSLILAVVVGPQTRAWTWGPAMLAMALALATSVPAIWRRQKSTWDFGLLIYAVVVAGWFGWRAWVSPVVELDQADLILLAGGISAFVVIRGIEGHGLAERIVTWGIALLLAANVAVVFKQVAQPDFSPLFRSRAAVFPSGFYAHYNEAANYLIASSLWVAAAAVFGKHARVSRVLLALVAIAGLAAVYYTRSRGGIFGAATGTAVFAVAALMAGKRTGARWFAPALVALPIVGIAIAVFLYSGWAERQSIQASAGSTMDNIFDNVSRLYFLGIAMSCIVQHVWLGGGSRSFSWESFQFFDGSQQGSAVFHLPEQVHNELVQAATDYGLIGAGLLTGLLGSWVVLAIVRVLFGEGKSTSPLDDAWRIGSLAALAGMFVQSCFSFVFHLFPGILLLGICLGQLSRTPVVGSGAAKGGSRAIGPKALLSLAAVACLAVLIPYGWKGSQVSRLLWPSYFSKTGVTLAESRADALEQALQIWPQSSLYKDRAILFQEVAASDAPSAAAAAQRAIDDYTRAEQLHPFNPDFPVNLGNLASFLKQDALAEAAYGRAIQLQGGMEASFRARFLMAHHLMSKGARQFDPANPAATVATMEQAAEQMEAAAKAMPWSADKVMTEPRVAAHESVGQAREFAGDFPGALKAYNLAAGLYGGSRAHYRAGELYRKMGQEIWFKRDPSRAMGYYIEARRRILLAGELPTGVTPQQRAEVVSYLDRTIAFFQRTQTEPIPVPAE
jgi:hypothetical protein